VKANPKLIQKFKTSNNKRNKSVYDVAGAVSDQELEAMVKLAIDLKEQTVAWLQKFHPELLSKETLRHGVHSTDSAKSLARPRWQVMQKMSAESPDLVRLASRAPVRTSSN
jgi:hypothetical protein